MVGQLIADRYELKELVGTGGMSSVYRAQDSLLERHVALKVMHEQLLSEGDHVERFRREARLAAQLSHPNIVTVIDRGEQESRQFIVFEYVEGENLKALIEREAPLPEKAAIELALQIADGLAFAHAHGLVHRDVKPHNVLLTEDGRAKVTDFGIARSIDVHRGLTQTGTVMGTSEYISPEQARGGNVDACTDIYSLGAVLYELLTGEVPFPGDNFVSIAMRHINEPPPHVADHRPDVPPRVDAAVQRAMAKDREDRFPTMADFCAELEACLAQLQKTQVLPPPRPVRRQRARRRSSAWPIVVALVALIAAGAVAAFLLLHQTGGNGNSKSSVHGGGSLPGGMVPLHAVNAYDPFGSPVGQEHNDKAHYATDGDSRTYWETESYNDHPNLDKPGVGLILDADKSVQLQQLAFSTGTPGFVAEIKGSDSAGGFSDVVAPPQTTGSVTKYKIHGGPFRYYLIWITKLGGNYSQAVINEVKAN